MNALSDKVAIVTGASSGIGRAAAQQFAEEGAAVVVAARRKEILEELVQSIQESGGHAIAVAGDVQDEAFAQRLVETAINAFGRLDIAFNNVGTTGEMGPVPEMPLAEWNKVLATNLTSAFLCAKYQLPAMQESGGGSLIFTSTFVGHTVGMHGMAAYAASKAGLVGLTQVLASEYGPKGIRVNALLPGGVDTQAARSFTDDPESRAFVENMHALKRIAQPDEIARSALYLASDASSFTTGSAMMVDGGVSINRL